VAAAVANPPRGVAAFLTTFALKIIYFGFI
jgi:hypothetical protein